MGALGTNLSHNDTTKIVIIEVVDKENCYEIASIYGNNEDFDILCTAPLYMPAHYRKENVNRYLKIWGRNLPTYTCKISHNVLVMSKEEAFKKILNATEPWQRKV